MGTVHRAIRCLAPAVSPNRFSPGVRRFIAEHIDSVTQLELLRVLHRDPTVSWTADEAGREMRLPTGWAAMHLERFDALGLLESSGGSDPRYRYRPDSEWAALVDEVAETFRLRRTSMTALIFAPTTRDISLLSDAFLLRREEEED